MRLRSYITIVFILFICNTYSQQTVPAYNDLVSSFQTAIKAKNFRDMKRSSDALVEHYRDDYAGYAFRAFFYMCRGQNAFAEKNVNIMLQLNPVSEGSYAVASYLSYILGRTDEAELYLQYAYQITTNPKFTEELYTDIDIIKEMAYRSDLEGFKTIVNKVEAQGFQNTDRSNTFFNELGGLYQGKAASELDKIVGELGLLKPYIPSLPLVVTYAKAFQNYYNYENENAKLLFEQFLKESEPIFKYQLRYYRAMAYNYIAAMAYNNYNTRVALVNNKKALSEIKKMPDITVMEALLLYNKFMYESELGLENESLQTSFALLALAKKINSDLYKAQACNNIGQYYLNSITERTKAASYIYDALQYAKQGGLPDLENTIRSNYVIVLFQQGRYDEAKSNSEMLYNAFMAKNDYRNAEVTANNLAFMLYYKGQYNEAAIYFKKAVDMTENIRSQLKPKQRLALMNNRSSSFSGLVMCYQKMGNAKRLFEAQESNRSRFLRDRLDPNMKASTLQDAQALLGANDLLLYYTLAGPGEIIINAITNTNAEVIYSYKIDDWIAMKKQWTDRTKRIPSAYNGFMSNYANDIVDGYFVSYANKSQSFTSKDFKRLVQWTRELLYDSDPKKNTVRTAFMKHWYKVALSPVQHLLNNKTNIIISASNELNYLPFEAFIVPNNNSYFIASHNVRYIPSVSVWKLLASRNYTADRKPAIAMGGAIYQPKGNVKGTARSIDDFYAISEQLEEKMAKGDYNFKTELEALGFGGASYLKGTLDEVTFVGQLHPDIKVVTGKAMKESYLKQLNATGALKQYKAIMLSTHGFTGDIIPEFSGVMMSQPDNGDGNEDTFLLAPEIAQLNLNADIAILSACDTGLGAIVGGEGINGLNAAFLIAGANSTMLSLWSVNDASTALTMKNFFKMTVIDGIDSFTALNTIKRAMATGQGGERLTMPSYWAPFLLNGL